MTTIAVDKQATVEGLMRTLNNDLNSTSLNDNKRSELLGQLKVYGRDPRGADAIFSRSGVETLCKYAFADYSPSVSQEALRCIANTLLLQPQLRIEFVGLGHVIAAAKVYQRQNDDDEFLGARILFLLTYGTTADFADLLSSHELAKGIESHLTRHYSTMSQGKRVANQMETMAMSESLKLIFNLANNYQSEAILLSIAVPALCTILIKSEIPSTPLEAPVGLVVNALAILDFETLSTTTANNASQEQYAKLAPKLVAILDRTVRKYAPAQLDTQAIPLITVLRKLYETCSADVKTEMRGLLLPDDSERDLPLGQSSTLASHLLRLTTSPGLSNLPEAISAFIFQMSDNNASIFVKNIGYGYAAGYLMTHDIPVPENLKHGGNINIQNEVPVNPITGQRLDKEDAPDMLEMTQEEKEREAERLFVLFERLKATGVVDVKNPVQQAMEDGRFEEVDSDPD